MKKIFLVIFLISRIIYGDNTKGKAWAKVEVLNKKVIIGEPIYIKLTKYATPYAGDIYLDGKKCDDPYIKGIEEKSSIFSSKYHLFNKINDSKKMKVEEEVKEQSFNILNNCDLMMKDMEEREYEVCYKDEWISACDRFSIEYPKGKDLEVFEKMGKEARDFTFPESRITTNEILENYPTSTYAGWAFRHYHFKHNIIEPFNNEEAREERIKYKDLIIEFLKFNRDFPFSGDLSAEAAYICSQIGDYKCACEEYKEAFKLKWEIPMLDERGRKKVIERRRLSYEKLKKEGKCK